MKINFKVMKMPNLLKKMQKEIIFDSHRYTDTHICSADTNINRKIYESTTN